MKNSFDLKDLSVIARRIERGYGEANKTHQMPKNSASVAAKLKSQAADPLAARSAAARVLGDGWFASLKKFIG